MDCVVMLVVFGGYLWLCGEGVVVVECLCEVYVVGVMVVGIDNGVVLLVCVGLFDGVCYIGNWVG